MYAPRGERCHFLTKIRSAQAPVFRRGARQYKIFVFADNQQINLATFEGTDGNGYYGTGYCIEVFDPTI